MAALAQGNTIGQTVVAVPLMIATRRICGPAALAGVNYAAGTGQAAGIVSGVAGAAICLAVPVSGKLPAVGVAMVAAGCAHRIRCGRVRARPE